jgi:DNA polymerase III epsilon subunit-like protein
MKCDKILALDFETSGVDPNQHAPVSLGVAVMEGEEVIESKEWLIAPPTHYKDKSNITRCYDERARLIHGYSLEHLIEHGEPCEKVCIGLTEFVTVNKAGNYPVVAYNAVFDLSFFNTLLFLGGAYDRHTAAFRPFPSPISGPWQCAKQLAERRQVRAENYKLDTIAQMLGLGEQGEVHGALTDAILAGRVFAQLREKAPMKVSA